MELAAMPKKRLLFIKTGLSLSRGGRGSTWLARQFNAGRSRLVELVSPHVFSAKWLK